MAKKYYWFKMPKNYYDRHDVKMIYRRLGAEASLCYNKIILQSIDHGGLLRFSEKKPYTNQTLAEAVDADYDEFNKLFKLLIDEGMIEILKDKTISIPFVSNRVGNESESAERMRKHREKKETSQKDNIVQDSDKCYAHSDTEIEIEKELEKEKRVRKNKDIYSENINLNTAILSFIEMRKKIKKPMTDNAISLMIKKLNRIAGNDTDRITILNNSIMGSWQGIFELKNNTKKDSVNDMLDQIGRGE